MDRRGFFNELTAGAKSTTPTVAVGRTQSGLNPYTGPWTEEGSTALIKTGTIWRKTQ